MSSEEYHIFYALKYFYSVEIIFLDFERIIL